MMFYTWPLSEFGMSLTVIGSVPVMIGAFGFAALYCSASTSSLYGLVN